jgi:hypothetical protein
MMLFRGTCLLACVALALEACAGLSAVEARPRAEDAPPVPEAAPAPKTSPSERLRDLPADKLPALTRAKPDPTREQLTREQVSVEFDETVEAKGNPRRAADVRVAENYVKAYLLRAGFPIVESDAGPSLSITGTVRAAFRDEILSLGRVVGWRYRASASIAVFDREGKELAKIDLPEFFQENARSEFSAALQVRRYLAKLLWDELLSKRDILGRPEVLGVLDGLCMEAGTTEFGDSPASEAPETVEEVVKVVADSGLKAVPYLLEALSDERTVRLPTKIASLQSRDPDRVKVFHVADKILEEIFQKVSRLPLECTREERFAVTAGWEGEWARFCPPYRAWRAAEAERRAQRAKASGR